MPGSPVEELNDCVELSGLRVAPQISRKFAAAALMYGDELEDGANVVGVRCERGSARVGTERRRTRRSDGLSLTTATATCEEHSF